MKSETMSVQQLFQDRRQYRVPFFQRPYVWNREDQWERLWTDISDKAEARLDSGPPVAHFLGATVLEPQQRSGLLGVETLNIIDGQQRLTTLQYFLAALAMILRDAKQSTLLSLLESCLWNTNTDTMQQPDVEVFKVWPTFRDRSNFRQVMKAESRDELRDKFPQSFTQAGTLKKIGIDHPPALEAVWYFGDQIGGWISSDSDSRKPVRLNAISEAVLRDLQIISISLGEEDDAQVIFETLNGYGAELHATDLIRNFIFMRADRDGADGNALFQTFWSQFEGAFWAEPQRRGRLRNPRIEWFLQTVLQTTLAEEVEIGRLYASYRRFALPKGAALKATAQLEVLDSNARSYQQLVSGVGEEPIAAFGRRTAVWEATTTHPLALRIAGSYLPAEVQTQMYNHITSYLVRRAICGLPTKNYNKFFLQQLKKLSASELTAESLWTALSSAVGDASRWPRDEEFKKAWVGEEVYPRRLDAQRIKAVLAELEVGLRSVRTEEPLPIGLDNLDVDHILPSSWFEYWPLPDGIKVDQSEAGAAFLATLAGEELSERHAAIRRREVSKATMGNLTLLHYGINRGAQNREFAVKREKLLQESNLHLNRSLMLLKDWDESAIVARGQSLFDVALGLWPGPKN